jgi:hypothetical protein
MERCSKLSRSRRIIDAPRPVIISGPQYRADQAEPSHVSVHPPIPVSAMPGALRRCNAWAGLIAGGLMRAPVGPAGAIVKMSEE